MPFAAVSLPKSSETSSIRPFSLASTANMPSLPDAHSVRSAKPSPSMSKKALESFKETVLTPSPLRSKIRGSPGEKVPIADSNSSRELAKISGNGLLYR